MVLKQYPPVGSHPGTLTTSENAYNTSIHIIDYMPEAVQEKDVFDVNTLVKFRDSKSVTWIDIEGLKDHKMLTSIAEIFGLHPLTLADIVNVPSNPKCENHGDYLLVITSMVKAESPLELITEQISIVLGHSFVLTFQERPGDELSPIRERILNGKGLIRKMNSDYLAYAIVDAIIDAYFPVLENIGEYLEDLEDQILMNPHQEDLHKIYQIRRELIKMRRLLWPQRDAINLLLREDTQLIKKTVKIYIRDLYDHCAQLIDFIENYRELCTGLNDVYLSGLSNRLNEVMKFLAAISTIFMPLAFLTGLYGMNFSHMPELNSRWAYPIWWFVVVLIAIVMVVTFYRRGWLKMTNGVNENINLPDKQE